MSMAVKNKGIQSDINITPYINILLVLLIIYVATTGPKLPKVHPIRVLQHPVDMRPDVLIVEMNLDHSIKLNDQAMPPEKIESWLLQIYSRRTIRNLFVCADSDLPYGDIFILLDIAQRSGAQDVILLEKGVGKRCGEDYFPWIGKGGSGSGGS
jgi:biopolymer transport protein TolR